MNTAPRLVEALVRTDRSQWSAISPYPSILASVATDAMERERGTVPSAVAVFPPHGSGSQDEVPRAAAAADRVDHAAIPRYQLLFMADELDREVRERILVLVRVTVLGSDDLRLAE